MSGSPGQLDYLDSIRATLGTRWIGQNLHYYPVTSSTNDILAAMAREDAPAGTVVVTDFQEHGKGRFGRRWIAPAGTSLLFSVLFRPSWPPEKAAWLTMIAGVATVRAIESVAKLSPQLKWPNDLVLPVAGQWLKTGGMLLEGQFTNGRLSASILGVGINVNIMPEQLPAIQSPATSLMKEVGGELSRVGLLAEILARLESGFDAADQGHSPRREWERLLVTLGRRVTVTRASEGRELYGTAESTDEWGRLLVRDDTGRLHALSAGDVTLQVDNSKE